MLDFKIIKQTILSHKNPTRYRNIKSRDVIKLY